MVKFKYVGLVTVEMTVHADPKDSREFEEVEEKFKREFDDVIKGAVEYECAGIETTVTVDQMYADMYKTEE